MGLLEQLVEEGPAVDVAGCLEPDVGRVDSTEDGDSDRLESFAEQPGIFEVEADQFADLLLPIGTVSGFGTALNGVRDAVELGAVSPVPQAVHLDPFARCRGAGQFVGDDRAGTADAGEAGILAEAAKLDSYLAGSVDLVDRMGDLWVGDVGLVGGIEQENRVVGTGVVDPRGQCVSAGHGPGGIVGVTEVSEVDRPVGQWGHEVVLGGDGQVHQSFEPSVPG